jgi:DNA-binding CsgD family transcriptional regulator
MTDLNQIIGQIYDCAAAPELWPQTLENVRSAADFAYVAIGLTDLSAMSTGGTLKFTFRSSPWDVSWFSDVGKRFQNIPGFQALQESEIDLAWVQLRQLPEAEFQQSAFHKEWVAPQGLRDAIMINILKRDRMMGSLSAATWREQPLVSDAQVQMLERLSPHVRRAMAIGDIIEKGKLQTDLHQKMLDQLSIAVFLVGDGSKVLYANPAAEAMLAEGTLVGTGNGLDAVRPDNGNAFSSALARALKGDRSMGLAGIGVPLQSADGERAAAYLLPIGVSDVRSQWGGGHAAVFVARRGEQQPALAEILRSVFDFTRAEARVATLIMQGENAAAVSAQLGISLPTTRSHLARIFAKTGAADRAGLVLHLSSLITPLNPR